MLNRTGGGTTSMRAFVALAALVGATAAASAATAGSGFSGATTEIVYSARVKGANSEIYVVKSNGGTPVRLTRNAATDGNPTWSPDGGRIAFESNRSHSGLGDYDVFVMRANGTKLRQLTF